MSKIMVLGKSLEGDFYDADFIDVFEAATKKMRDRAAEGIHTKYESLGDAMRAQCKIAKDYFDEIFGEGTSLELFGPGNNLKLHMQAVADLTDQAMKNRKETNDFINKYTQRQKAQQVRFQQNYQHKKHK